MPDPSMTDALAEAYALAPSGEIVLNTLEIRHPTFVDDDGNLTSIFIVADTADLIAPLESDAPVKGGQTIRFVAFGFSIALTPIEPGITPEIEVTVDGTDRSVIQYFDLAIESGVPIIIAYRPYLATAPGDGPQMDPIMTFELSEIHVTVTGVKARARTGIDLRGAFPIRTYTAAEFPGLIGS